MGMQETSRARHGLRSRAAAVLAMAATVLLAGCSTQQVNTQATVDLPVPVQRLLVVYQTVALNQVVARRGNMSVLTEMAQAPRKARVIELLGTAVEGRLQPGLEQRGIHARFVQARAIETVLGSQAVRTAVSHVLLVRAQADDVTCTGLGSCSHRLKVRVFLFRSGQPEVIWRTDLQEPFMNSSFIYQARYDEMADHILRALGGVLVPAKPVSPAP